MFMYIGHEDVQLPSRVLYARVALFVIHLLSVMYSCVCMNVDLYVGNSVVKALAPS